MIALVTSKVKTMWTIVTFLVLGFWSLACFASPTTLADLLALRNTTVRMRNVHEPFMLNSFNKSLNSEGVFIKADTWFGTAQLGNRLSNYFEGVSCSDIAGTHFIYRPSIKGEKDAVAFFNSLPVTRLHPHPAHLSQYALSHKWNRTCPDVEPYPHENAGAWSHRPDLIAEIIHNTTNALYDDIFSETIPTTSFVFVKADKPVGDALPLVPSAAVMFRCVDILHFGGNAVGYGFLNFNAYTELIPNDVSHIYVLGEEMNYLDNKNKASGEVCTNLVELLVDFLHKHFPAAVVALRRGHAIESFLMISNTQTFVSAPSTFSLWGGIANTNRVYLMASGKNPLLRDAPYIRDNFMWLTYPELILGGDHGRDFTVLSHVLTRPLEKPVHIVTHVPKGHKP